MAQVFLGMSGGVDSSAAAVLLQEQGYAVSGLHLSLLSGLPLPADRLPDDGSDARAVASLLGLPFYDMDLSPELRATVIDYFIREYEAGHTPNPCVFCNRRIKFGAMWDAARKLGADYLATGHYAKIRQDPATGRHLLCRGADRSKDQSYFLCRLTQEQLSRTRIFGFCFSHTMMSGLQTPADILEEAVLYLRVYFVGFPFLFMYNILSTMFTSIGESKIPLGLLIFSSLLNIVMDLWMVAGLGLGVFGAALATLIAQGISAVFSLVIFFSRMRRYQSPFQRFDGRGLRSMLRIAVPSVLQQSTVSIGMMIVQAVVNPFGTQALAGYAATMRVENVFSLIFVSIGNAVSPYVSQNLGAGKTERIKKGYHAALVLDVCFAALAFLVIETLHTQISSLFLGKDGTALAYQVSGDYMRWLGYFFIFMGIKMATDGVLRGLGIMRPFLIANMVNLAIRLSVALICAPRFGIDFVWLAVPAGWLANFLVSYAALRKSWPAEEVEPF